MAGKDSAATERLDIVPQVRQAAHLLRSTRHFLERAPVLGCCVLGYGSYRLGGTADYFTEVSTFSESFADEPFRCQDELYAQTVCS